MPADRHPAFEAGRHRRREARHREHQTDDEDQPVATLVLQYPGSGKQGQGQQRRRRRRQRLKQFYRQNRGMPAGAVAIRSLAVLPFVNSSRNADTEYVADGITQTLIDSLSQLPNLKVISRNTVFAFKGKTIDIPTLTSTDLANADNIKQMVGKYLERDTGTPLVCSPGPSLSAGAGVFFCVLRLSNR